MFKLAHLSDPHLGPLPRPSLQELMSKRALGYLNWQRSRARTYRPEILFELIENIHGAAPDHIAVTGDLVNIALREEITAARQWLDALGDPQQVTVIPGNHDAYVPGALAETRRQWGPFMTGDETPDRVTFPFVRRRGPIALVGVNSARATAPFMATGHISERQLGQLEATLKKLGEEGLFRVVLLHHPPAPSFAFWSHRLVEAAEFRDVVRRAGAELVLHGHDHVGTIVFINGADGRVPVVGVPSASNSPSITKPGAAFNLYRIEGVPGNFTCSMTEIGFTHPEKPAGIIKELVLAE